MATTCAFTIERVGSSQVASPDAARAARAGAQLDSVNC